MRRISRYNWTPKKHSHISSKHFTADSFVPTFDPNQPISNIKYRRVNACAIPTLYLNGETNMMEIKINDAAPSGTVFQCSKFVLSILI